MLSFRTKRTFFRYDILKNMPKRQKAKIFIQVQLKARWKVWVIISSSFHFRSGEIKERMTFTKRKSEKTVVIVVIIAIWSLNALKKRTRLYLFLDKWSSGGHMSVKKESVGVFESFLSGRGHNYKKTEAEGTRRGLIGDFCPRVSK